MAWTTPRTWTDEELIDDDIMNAHVKDNLVYLKDVVDSAVVLKTLFDAANTILKADVQATPEGLTVAEQRLVGRITDGVITGLTGAQVMALLSGQAGAAFSLNSEDLSYVGHIGLGNNAADVGMGIYYDETIAITDDLDKVGSYMLVQAYKTSATYLSILKGGDFLARIKKNNTQNWTDAIGLRGVDAFVQLETGAASPSTITGAASLYASAGIGGAANDMVLINYFGLYVAANSLVGNDKLTNCYGIKVEDQEGGATLNYAIHTGAGLVHFGDDVDIASHMGLGGVAAHINYGIRYGETLLIDDDLARAGALVSIEAYKTSAAYADYLSGGKFTAGIPNTNTQNWDAGLIGVWGRVATESGTAAEKTVVGMSSFFADFAIGYQANDIKVTNYYGLRVSAAALVASDKLDNDYGIYVGHQRGGATLNYAIYTNDGIVRFGDNLEMASGKTVDGIDIKTIQTRALMFALCS